MNSIRKHYVWTLIGRSLVCLALIWYVCARPQRAWAELMSWPLTLTPITAFWALLLVHMSLRFFPSRRESLGCQKMFASRLRPTGRMPGGAEIRKADRGAVWVLLVWLGANGVILVLWRVLNWEPVYLLCLAGFYSVCDIVCILFFCPFQVLWMKNRCCTTCRVYNWDFLMMCTPLAVIPSFYTLSLTAVAAALVIRWEIVYRRHPERFFESGNEALRCGQCQERLCAYKRKLAGWREKKHEKKAV